MWCTPCPITRRGAVVGELNRSARRDLEHFCRVEARARLGWQVKLPPPARGEGALAVYE